MVVPENLKYTVTVLGEGEGRYSITTDSLVGNTQTTLHVLRNATATPALVATFTRDADGFSPLAVDYDGDGKLEAQYTLDGVEVVKEVLYTYADLKNAATNLNLQHGQKVALAVLIRAAERLSNKKPVKINKKLEKVALNTVKKMFGVYYHRGKITKVEHDMLINILNFLIK